MKDILVKTLGTKDVISLPPEAELRQAVKQMIDNRNSCMIIEKK